MTDKRKRNLDAKDVPDHPPLKRLKTGKLERRLGVLKLGLKAGSRVVASSAAHLFVAKAEKEQHRHSVLARESERFVDELGEYKGSVVKIGQMMALWGEHYLPSEVTEALHKLEDNTAHMSWELMEEVLQSNLSAEKLAELEIDPFPIGAASLGQVHRAVRKSDGAQLCLKIQYPGVAEAIDSDLDMVELLLKVSRIVPFTQGFKLWFEEIRRLLKQEVDYLQEAETTIRFKEFLKDDPRYVVPSVYKEYSNNRIIAFSYEEGERISSDLVVNLSANRRNKLAETCLDLCWREVFEWGEMQTDPNFGNYLVKIDDYGEDDRLVLLDFGAVRSFEVELLEAGKSLIKASVQHDYESVKQVLVEIGFFKPGVPEKTIKEFADLCFLAIEPFAATQTHKASEPTFYDEEGLYHWSGSHLADRVLRKASYSAFSKHFCLPPKDFMFISRKFVGAFTLMCVLDAKTSGKSLVGKYISDMNKA